MSRRPLFCLPLLAVLAGPAAAATLTWGAGGAGGGGAWDTTTANWWDGAQNVPWAEGGHALFAGAGGPVTSFTFGPRVSSITFDAPGYAISGGWLQGGDQGLAIVANADATIGSVLSDTNFPAGGNLSKSGAGALTVAGTNFFDSVYVGQGDFRATGSSTLFFSKVRVESSAVVTLAPSSGSASMASISGSGTVRPDDSARTVTLTLYDAYEFTGQFTDHGTGQLAVNVFFPVNPQLPAVWMGASTYTGPTTITSGTLNLRSDGSITQSAVTIGEGAALALSNDLGPANRLNDHGVLTMRGGKLTLAGAGFAAAFTEAAGPLSVEGANQVVSSRGSRQGVPTLAFDALQRVSRGTLNVSGDGAVTFASLASSQAAIADPYVTFGTDWAAVTDGRLSAFTAYATDLNSGSSSEHVKLTSSATLAQSTTKLSLNLRNDTAASPSTLDLAGRTLALATGGLLSSGAGPATITNGFLSTSSNEFIVTNANDLTLGARLVGSAGLTKSGAGKLTLANVQNLYTGPTTINEGILEVQSSAAFANTTSLQFDGGTLRFLGSSSIAKDVVVGAGGGTLDTAAFSPTIFGTVTGSLTKTGSGTLAIRNHTLGDLTVAQGRLSAVQATTGSVALFADTTLLTGANVTLARLSLIGRARLTIGSNAAGNLQTSSVLFQGSDASLNVDFDLGGAAQDHWTITSLVSGASSSALVFDFHDLGGLATGVDYEVLTLPNFGGGFLQPSNFALAPSLVSQGWSGTFRVDPRSVTVNFAALPEPSAVLLLLFAGGLAGLGRVRKSR